MLDILTWTVSVFCKLIMLGVWFSLNVCNIACYILIESLKLLFLFAVQFCHCRDVVFEEVICFS